MSATSWAKVLSEVLDDDQRTRRADVLLSHITVWLIILAVAAAATAPLLTTTPWWVSTGVGSIGALAAGLAIRRRRRRLGSTDQQIRA